MAKIKINQIAEELNLSRNTISKVLNNKDGVSEKTKQIVINKAKQMGYKQVDFEMKDENDLEMEKKGSLLLITEKIPMNPHFGVRALETFQKEIAAKGFIMEISIVTAEEIKNRSIPERVREDTVKGIVCIEMFDKKYSALLCELKKPILFFDCAVGIDESYPTMDLILMENQNSVGIIVDKMLNKNYRKFGFIGDKNRCRSFYERWEVCDRKLKQVGIDNFEKCSVCEERQEKYLDYYWLYERLKEIELFPEVFFCVNDQIALVLLRALKEMGLSVPKDIKVIGFDDMPEAIISNPTLTTVHINSDAIGSIGADLILSRIGNAQLPSRYTYVQTIPIFRETTEN